MALSDKTIVVTPRTGVGSPLSADPSILFAASDGGSPDPGALNITLFARPINSGTLSFEGTSGQLFSITNDLTGTIFSVNDISGVPSIEVNADGTIALAEFGGNVGIGTGSPSERFHIVGRDVASSNTKIRIDSRGDAVLELRADRVSDTELENAYLYLSQDADAVVSIIGTIGGANVDSQNNAFTGSTNNSLGIHHKFATGVVDIGVNGQVGLTIDDSNNVTVKNSGTFVGDLTGNADTASSATSAAGWTTGRTITLSGDVSGTSPAWDGTGNLAFSGTVVANDSHTHTFANLTSKESGTGIYRTTTNFQATNGLIGTYDDATGSDWAGPIWGMDDGFTGPTGGTDALATSTYGLRWNRVAASVAHADIGEGLYVYQAGNLYAGMGSVGIYSAGTLDVTGIATFNNDVKLLDNDQLEFGTTSTDGDVQMYSNGTDFIIEATAANNVDFIIRGGSTGTENWIHCLDDGAVTLYYNGVAMLGTQSNVTNTSAVYVRANNLSTPTTKDIGFNTLDKQEDNPASVALSEQHCGSVIFADDNTAFTVTVEASGGSTFPIGGMTTIINANSSVALTIADNSTAVYYMDGASATDIGATGTLAAGGVANIWREAAGVYYLWGTGITV